MHLDSQLTELISSELVRRLPEAELAYLFKHALIQDTAYSSLLKHERARLHLQVANALESFYPERRQEFAGLIGKHFALAGERAQAAWYLREAARFSITRYAYLEATQDLELALSLFQPEEANETLLGLLEEAGDAYRLLRNGARTMALYQQALSVWDKVGGAERLIRVRLYRKIIQVALDFMFTVAMEVMQGDTIATASQAALQTELELLKDAPPDPEIAQALGALSVVAWRIQVPPDWDTALSFAQDAVAMAEGLDVPAILSNALDALANIYDSRSRLREHLEIASRRHALTQSTAIEDVREKLDALRGLGMAQMYVGEYQEALPVLREAEALAERIQAYEMHSYALGLQAQCLFRLDRWDEVLELEKNWRTLERRYSREQVGVT